MGSLGPAISIPEVIPTLGLIIFIYTIGIQSGPEFFNSLRQRGYRDSVFALAIVVLGAGVTLVVSRPAHLTRARAAGLYTGAMTNTPALAAARELLRERGRSAGLSPEQLRAASDEPVVAYSIAYPMGVIGVLVSFAVLRRRWKPGMEPPAEGAEIRARDFAVMNPAVMGRTVEEVLRPHRDPGFVVSRIQHGGASEIVRGDTQLERGDIVVSAMTTAWCAPNKSSASPSRPTSNWTARSSISAASSFPARRSWASASANSTWRTAWAPR
ncbi:MAG: hypothetical protein ACHP78_15495 [Terriglobales bacterium]